MAPALRRNIGNSLLNSTSNCTSNSPTDCTKAHSSCNAATRSSDTNDCSRYRTRGCCSQDFTKGWGLMIDDCRFYDCDTYTNYCAYCCSNERRTPGPAMPAGIIARLRVIAHVGIGVHAIGVVLHVVRAHKPPAERIIIPEGV